MRDPRKPLPTTHPAIVAHRTNSARRIVRKWTSTYPSLPRAVREELADLLLQEDPADPTEAATAYADQPGGAE